jgi:hypothetical protein
MKTGLPSGQAGEINILRCREGSLFVFQSKKRKKRRREAAEPVSTKRS